MRLRSAFNRVRSLAGRQSQYSPEEWDREYSTSTWNYLRGLEQLPRYSVIDGWRRQLKPTGSVLDVGCGEGVLFEQIAAGGSVNYTGVDISQVAIDVALTKVRDASRERFLCADVVTFEPAAGVDVIVFNEVLYYLADPMALVRRYRKALAPDGIVIVSIFHANLRTWKAINMLLKEDCRQTIFVHDNESGKRWYLGLYQEPVGAAQTKRKG